MDAVRPGHPGTPMGSLLFLTGAKAVDERCEQTGEPALSARPMDRSSR